jgi:ferrochelatase
MSALQKPLAYVISKRRAPKSRAAYESIGGGSPIVRYTREQAAGIETRLKQKGLDAKCYVAMRYWHPFTQEALAEMKADGVNTLVVVPLYPQFSISTSGSSLRTLQDLFFKDPAVWGGVRHTVVPAWYDRPGYVRAMGRLIQQELEKFTPEQRAAGPLNVLFSAHGVPQRYIQMGDPYQEQIERCVQLIAREYSAEAVTHLSYQSRVGPIEWLRPYTDDKLEELGASGVKNLVVVPISFVSEHIETLEEIDMEYRELAEEKGIVNWRRVPALNTDAGFLEDLADMVVDALKEPTITVTEACALNNLDIQPVFGGDSDDARQGKLALLGVLSSVLLDIVGGKGIVTMLHLLGL